MSKRSPAEPTAARTYVDGRFEPVHEERTVIDLDVTGAIPDDLNGRYVRIGPNPISPDPGRHLFTGAGMVHGVRLADGRAQWYRNRWVRTPDVSAELGEPPLSRPPGRERDTGPVNTNVLRIGGRATALVEAGSCPVELGDDLATVRISDFEGTLAGSFSAHPRLDPVTGRWHAITYHWSETSVHHVVVGSSGTVERDVAVDVGDRPMVHDTAITESSIVILDLPVTFDLDDAIAGATFPYHWNPHRASRVGVLPLDGEASDIRWCDVPQCWVFHTVNAFNADDGRVVLDVVRWEKVFDSDRLAPSESPTWLERWVLDPATGSTAQEVLDERSLEFPRIDDRLTGRRARYAYAPVSIADGGAGAMVLHRYDLERGTVDIVPLGAHDAQEFVVVPRDHSRVEDDAWLIGYATDHDRARTDLVVLAADDLNGGPVARVHLPLRVPDGFHGNWLADL